MIKLDDTKEGSDIVKLSICKCEELAKIFKWVIEHWDDITNVAEEIALTSGGLRYLIFGKWDIKYYEMEARQESLLVNDGSPLILCVTFNNTTLATIFKMTFS